MPEQFGLGLATAAVVRPTAEVMALANVLGLTATQLEERVAQELEDNPALERDPLFVILPSSAGSSTSLIDPFTPSIEP
jgi:hypothetical protein